MRNILGRTENTTLTKLISKLICDFAMLNIYLIYNDIFHINVIKVFFL